MTAYTPNIRQLYRLPFSKNDNPNGWIEITTFCNQKCPGCYRGCDRPETPQIHQTLDDIKKNIEDLIQIRNCRIISISGGEPLLHPGLEEVIRFIRSKNLLAWLHTNGIALTEERLGSLKKAGLNGIIIRVDSLTEPEKSNSEKDLNLERLKFAERVYKTGGIHLSFICVVNKYNINEIPDIIEWAMSHHHLVDFLAFISFRQIKFSPDDIVDKTLWVTLEDFCRVVYERIPALTYASFLGGVYGPQSVKWLQSLWLSMNGKVLGYAGPRLVELFQVYHHFRHGKYAYKFGGARSSINFLQAVMIAALLKEFRTTAVSYMKMIIQKPSNLFKKANLQLMCFIIPPGENDNRADVCEGCPDAILYHGELYPSCGIDEYINSGRC